MLAPPAIMVGRFLGQWVVLQPLPSPRSRRAPRFKDLRVRPKLIVLHNTFYILLACAVYYSVIPLVEDHIATDLGFRCHAP